MPAIEKEAEGTDAAQNSAASENFESEAPESDGTPDVVLPAEGEGEQELVANEIPTGDEVPGEDGANGGEAKEPSTNGAPGDEVREPGENGAPGDEVREPGADGASGDEAKEPGANGASGGEAKEPGADVASGDAAQEPDAGVGSEAAGETETDGGLDANGQEVVQDVPLSEADGGIMLMKAAPESCAGGHRFKRVTIDGNVLGIASRTATGHTAYYEVIQAKQCSVCKFFDPDSYKVIDKREEAKEEPHNYSADNPGICAVCGYKCKHPDVTKGEGKTVWEEGDWEYGRGDSLNHIHNGKIYYTFTCNTCHVSFDGTQTAEGSDYELGGYEYVFDREPHEYDEGSNTCKLCGYEKTELQDACGENHQWEEESGYEDEPSTERSIFTPYDSSCHSARGFDIVVRKRCKVCGITTEWEHRGFDPNRVEYREHRWNGVGVCKLCGYEQPCEHKRREIVKIEQEDVLLSGTLQDNGNGTHSGKYVERVSTRCMDCAWEETTTRVVEGIRKCNFGEDGTCICGAKHTEHHWSGKQEDLRISAPSGEGDPKPNPDGKSHTFEKYCYYTQKICEICGEPFGESTEIEVDEKLTEVHRFDSWDKTCRVCGASALPCEEHELATRVSTMFPISSITPLDQEKHYVVYGEEAYCTKCGLIVYVPEEEWENVYSGYTAEEPHEWLSNGVCRLCGAVRACGHEGITLTEPLDTEVTYAPVAGDDVLHQKIITRTYRCPKCLTTVTKAEEPELVRHSYATDAQGKGSCTQCGYKCTHAQGTVNRVKTDEKYFTLSAAQHQKHEFYRIDIDCPTCGMRAGDAQAATEEVKCEAEAHHFGDDGKCAECGYAEDAQEHHFSAVDEYVRYEDAVAVDDTCHRYTRSEVRTVYRCEDCQALGVTHEYEQSTTRELAEAASVPHVYDDDYVCTVCGYSRAEHCKHENVVADDAGFWGLGEPVGEQDMENCVPGSNGGHLVPQDYMITYECLDCGYRFKQRETRYQWQQCEYDSDGACIYCGAEQSETEPGCDHLFPWPLTEVLYGIRRGDFKELSRSYSVTPGSVMTGLPDDPNGHTYESVTMRLTIACAKCGETTWADYTIEYPFITCPVPKDVWYQPHRDDGTGVCAECGAAIPHTCDHANFEYDMRNACETNYVYKDAQSCWKVEKFRAACRDCGQLLNLFKIVRTQQKHVLGSTGSNCVYCGEYPDVLADCTHDNLRSGRALPDRVSCASIDDRQHEKTTARGWVCPDCRAEVYPEDAATRETVAHDYVDGVCTAEGCGHACGHSETHAVERDKLVGIEEKDDAVHTEKRADCDVCDICRSELSVNETEKDVAHSYEYSEAGGGYVCAACGHICGHQGAEVRSETKTEYLNANAAGHDVRTTTITTTACPHGHEPVVQTDVKTETGVAHSFSDDCCTLCGYAKPDDPGTTDPGTTDPGTTDPGTTDPGTTDPGTTEPGTTDPGTTDPGTTDPGTTDPGTTEPEVTEPAATSPETAKPDATRPEAARPTQQPVATDEPLYAEVALGTAMHGVTANSNTRMATALGMAVMVIEMTGGSDVQVHIRNVEKVLPQEERAAFEALPVQEQVMALVALLGGETEEQQGVHELGMMLSDGAEALIAELRSWLENLSPEERTAFEALVKEHFTVAGEDGHLVVTLEIKAAGGYQLERYSFDQTEDGWVLSKMETAGAEV